MGRVKQRQQKEDKVFQTERKEEIKKVKIYVVGKVEIGTAGSVKAFVQQQVEIGKAGSVKAIVQQQQQTGETQVSEKVLTPCI